MCCMLGLGLAATAVADQPRIVKSDMYTYVLSPMAKGDRSLGLALGTVA